MIDIHIEHTDYSLPWFYRLTSDVIDVNKYPMVQPFRYAETAEEAFRLALAARDEINFRYWMENQTEIQF